MAWSKNSVPVAAANVIFVDRAFVMKSDRPYTMYEGTVNDGTRFEHPTVGDLARLMQDYLIEHAIQPIPAWTMKCELERDGVTKKEVLA